MNEKSYLHSIWTLLFASLILPILGLILIWYQQGRHLITRILGSVAIVGYGVIHFYVIIFALYNLKVLEPSGGVLGFYVNRSNSESHFQEIERSRTEKKTIQSPPIAESYPHQPYWTEFRGPKRDGIYSQPDISIDWPSIQLNPVWQQPIGGGYASFVSANGVAFTIEQRRDQEVAAAYQIQTGQEVWTYSWPAQFEEFLGGPGPRATPTWHNGQLFVLGAQGDLHCLNAADGKPVWHVNILTDNNAQNIEWGMSASPLIVDDLVIVVPGGANSNVVAYEKSTGKKRWSALNDGIEYSTPMTANVLGTTCVIQITKKSVVGLNPGDGSVLWTYGWETPSSINISQPVFIGEDRMFLSTGYGYGCELVKFTKEGDAIAAEQVWKNRNMKNKMASSVYKDGYLYGLDDTVLVCLDGETGERKWKGGRYGYGQLLLSDNHLILLSEKGDIAMVEATPQEHREIHKVNAIKGKTWNYPAMVDGYLLVRNASEMACYDLLANRREI